MNVVEAWRQELKELLQADPVALDSLLRMYVSVSDETCDSPALICAERYEGCSTSFLGLVNGLLDSQGLQRIAMVIDGSMDGFILDFELFKSSPSTRQETEPAAFAQGAVRGLAHNLSLDNVAIGTLLTTRLPCNEVFFNRVRPFANLQYNATSRWFTGLRVLNRLMALIGCQTLVLTTEGNDQLGVKQS